ncbi:hypothetical protein AAEX28_04855 [Lentisphaerota bacterium WC36G]|nr:hypothetical protein LJT99_07235 [Lentisphaerae bacterium WC36]UDQ99418.1 hypothetical protein LJT99_07715 [Lentisphaerae bacterium WC36]
MKYFKIQAEEIQQIADKSNDIFDNWYEKTEELRATLEKLTDSKINIFHRQFKICRYKVTGRNQQKILVVFTKKSGRNHTQRIRQKHKNLIDLEKKCNEMIMSFETRRWMFANFEEMVKLSNYYCLKVENTNRILFLDNLTAGFINDEFAYWQVGTQSATFNEKYQPPKGAIEILFSEYKAAEKEHTEKNEVTE